MFSFLLILTCLWYEIHIVSFLCPPKNSERAAKRGRVEDVAGASFDEILEAMNYGSRRKLKEVKCMLVILIKQRKGSFWLLKEVILSSPSLCCIINILHYIGPFSIVFFCIFSNLLSILRWKLFCVLVA